MRRGKPWTPEEDAIIRQHYAKDWREATSRMPYRSRGSVAQRALRIGVKMRHRWTEQEDALLWQHWGIASLREVAALVGRSMNATSRRAYELGIGRGCPSGFEYFSHATERTGYDAVALRRILRAAGVRIVAASSVTSGRKGSHHYVDPHAVNMAVARWHETEPVDMAARIRGLSSVTLRGWIAYAVALGFKVPPRPGGKRHWRIPSATIDAIIADRRKRETLCVAARRLGVRHDVLSAWLRSARVARPKHKVWLLPVGVADDVVARRLSIRLPGVVAERRAA